MQRGVQAVVVVCVCVWWWCGGVWVYERGMWFKNIESKWNAKAIVPGELWGVTELDVEQRELKADIERRRQPLVLAQHLVLVEH